MACSARARERRDQAGLEVDPAYAVSGDVGDEERAAAGVKCDAVGFDQTGPIGRPAVSRVTLLAGSGHRGNHSSLTVNLSDPTIEAIDEIKTAARVKRDTIRFVDGGQKRRAAVAGEALLARAD